VTGQVTVAAKDDIVVTGDLTMTSGLTGADAIGLVAGNYVWVYHPVNSANHNLLTQAQHPHDIEAAILALRHSFLVQNWERGAALSSSSDAATKLNVTGSISQKYRGPVGTTGGTGYLKNYVYDRRLTVLQPPYFLKPVSATWQVANLSDQ
jgi:7-keto-8-aminopelargonate synthetase-like enzyme